MTPENHHPVGRSGIPHTLGAKVRARREKAGVSVRALAREVGCSPSLISQIELGGVNPSAGVLYDIVTALGMSLDELFHAAHGAGDEGDALGVAKRRRSGAHDPVLRKRDRMSLNLATGVRWERLTAGAEPDVDFLWLTYAVDGASSPEHSLMQHDGREFGVVLEGRLGLTVGAETYQLEPGDSFSFSSSLPHRLWTIGDVPCVITGIVVRHDHEPPADLHDAPAGFP